jgi:hypothetical protein
MQKQTGLKKILSVIDVGLEFNIYTGVYMWVPIFFLIWFFYFKLKKFNIFKLF